MDIFSICIKRGFGVLIRFTMHTYFRMHWYSFGELIFPRFCLVLFGKTIFNTMLGGNNV
jgi:hypothetical protein